MANVSILVENKNVLVLCLDEDLLVISDKGQLSFLFVFQFLLCINVSPILPHNVHKAGPWKRLGGQNARPVICQVPLLEAEERTADRELIHKPSLVARLLPPGERGVQTVVHVTDGHHA